MAATLADGSTIHNSSAVDGPIRCLGQSSSLDISIRCHALAHLSSDLVFGMECL